MIVAVIILVLFGLYPIYKKSKKRVSKKEIKKNLILEIIENANGVDDYPIEALNKKSIEELERILYVIENTRNE